jgi:hypothetical protein
LVLLFLREVLGGECGKSTSHKVDSRRVAERICEDGNARRSLGRDGMIALCCFNPAPRPVCRMRCIGLRGHEQTIVRCPA